jgi:hypothetical protein
MFGSFPPSPLVVSASKVYSGLGADIVHGIISLRTPVGGSKSEIAWLQRLQKLAQSR